MRHALQLLLLAALPLVAAHAAQAQQAAPPPPAGPIHVANYVEVAPTAAGGAITLLKQYRDAARKADGNVRVEIAQELGRPGRLVLLEIWKDNAAFEANGKAAHTGTFR